MSVEIEKKFLVKDNWQEFVDLNECEKSYISQGYLSTNPNKTIRVRVRNDKGYLTIKGKQTGLSRPEYEYEIPLMDANDIFKMCEYSVAKTRYVYTDECKQVWEIDVFKGCHEGLVLAEIELDVENQAVALPEWIGVDVSEDYRYTNSYMATHIHVK